VGENRRKVGKARRKWEANSKTDLKEIRHLDMKFIYVAQDVDQWRTLVNKVMKVRIS
jgi:hypothetical protein